MLSTATSGDLITLFVVLAFIAFALAVFAAFRGAIVAAAACGLIGVLILIFGT